VDAKRSCQKDSFVPEHILFWPDGNVSFGQSRSVRVSVDPLKHGTQTNQNKPMTNLRFFWVGLTSFPLHHGVGYDFGYNLEGQNKLFSRLLLLTGMTCIGWSRLKGADFPHFQMLLRLYSDISGCSTTCPLVTSLGHHDSAEETYTKASPPWVRLTQKISIVRDCWRKVLDRVPRMKEDQKGCLESA